MLTGLPARGLRRNCNASGSHATKQCKAKLGHYNWAGMQAPSGAWVNPAFCLHQSKLDKWQPRAAPAQQASSRAEARQRCRTAWYTHVIFDCDGVLVDSERASCEALRRSVLEVTGVSIPGEFPDDYVPVFGMSVAGAVGHYAKTIAPEWDVEDVAARVQTVKEGHFHELTEPGLAAFGGIRALILEARSLGMVVGIGSSGLLSLFDDDKIVSATTVPNGKPAPDVYVEALRRAGCADPQRAIIIEDAVNGLKAARGSGAYVVAVTNTLPAAMLAPHADRVVAHVTELDLAAMTAPGGADAEGI